LIDFGLARDIQALRAEDVRGGVPFYFDPEYCRGATPAAIVHPGGRRAVFDRRVAVSTVDWRAYLDWSLERDEMLRQIVETIQSHSRRAAFRLGLPWSDSRRALDNVRAALPGPEVLADALRAMLPSAGARSPSHPASFDSNCGSASARSRAGSLCAGGRGLRDGLPERHGRRSTTEPRYRYALCGSRSAG